MHDRFLEFADEVDRVLHPLLRISTERPIATPEEPADKIDRRVKREQELVANVTDESEPADILHDGIELVPVDDEDAAVVCRGVTRALLDGDVAVSAFEARDEFVVISRQVDDPRAFPRGAPDILHNGV